MDGNDTVLAIDFLARTSATLSNAANTSFYKKLTQDLNFKEARSGASAVDPFKLANAVALGLLIYYSDRCKPFSANVQARAKNAAVKLLRILEESRVFECEAEQFVVKDMLKHLSTAGTPTRGQTSTGTTEQKRKLIYEILMATQGLNLTAEVISDLAAVVDPDIAKEAVESVMRRKDFTEWKDYSRDFFNKVYLPYFAFRINHDD